MTGARKRGRDEGAALVEMALILPVLLLLVLGMIEFSRVLNANVTLNHATREGVRHLAIHADESAAVDVTKDAAQPLLDPNDLSVNTTACNPGEQTSVSASYPYEYSIPFFGTGTWTLSSEAVMRCGG